MGKLFIMKNVSITELANKRQQLLGIFNAREVDNDSIDLPEFKRICRVESKIAEATFRTDVEKLAGLTILFEDDEGPDFGDSFKVKLFARMREFS
jgi:hypothetical protein